MYCAHSNCWKVQKRHCMWRISTLFLFHDTSDTKFTTSICTGVHDLIWPVRRLVGSCGKWVSPDLSFDATWRSNRRNAARVPLLPNRAARPRPGERHQWENGKAFTDLNRLRARFSCCLHAVFTLEDDKIAASMVKTYFSTQKTDQHSMRESIDRSNGLKVRKLQLSYFLTTSFVNVCSTLM